MNPVDPHAGAKIVTRGEPLATAKAALILIHGRGVTAESILELTPAIGHPGVAYLAPEAVGNTWYPHSFLRPFEFNEPFLTSALACVDRLVEHVLAAGIPSERLAIGGFSQGACLTQEYAVRHPRRFGAILGLSGGLIGPPGTTWESSPALAGTPVFIGCSDVDDHVPLSRVNESAEVFRKAGAEVDERIYAGMAHTVNMDEAEACRAMIADLLLA